MPPEDQDDPESGEAGKTGGEGGETGAEGGPGPGQEVEIPGAGRVSLDELAKGYLRQQDYTKKTQELARRREELKDLEDFARLVDSNPDLREEIQEAVAKHMGTAAPEAGPPERPPRPEGRRRPSEPGERQVTDLSLKLAIHELKDYARDEFGRALTEEDIEKIAQHALREGIAHNLRLAYRDMMAAELRAAAGQKTPPPRTAPRTGAKGGGAEPVPKTLKEAEALEVQRIREIQKAKAE